MNRTQHWCDNCGKLVGDKSDPKNESTHYESKIWEIWSPNDREDQVLCSLQCVIEKADDLMTKEIEAEKANENN